MRHFSVLFSVVLMGCGAADVEPLGGIDFLGHETNSLDSVTVTVIADSSDGLNRVMDLDFCLLYTSPSPRDATLSRMPSSA